MFGGKVCCFFSFVIQVFIIMFCLVYDLYIMICLMCFIIMSLLLVMWSYSGNIWFLLEVFQVWKVLDFSFLLVEVGVWF